jgi:ribosomal protein S18 acetylase RimI-like enzyme
VFAEVDVLHRSALPDVFQPPGEQPPENRDATVFAPKTGGVPVFLAASSLGSPDSALLVAEHEGRVVGAVLVAVRETLPAPTLVARRLAMLDSIAVKQEFRRSGIGRALMAGAAQWAREQGASQIELSVYEFNRPALAFYRKLGFRTASRRLRKRV